MAEFNDNVEKILRPYLDMLKKSPLNELRWL